jgi:L-fuconolactonase
LWRDTEAIPTLLRRLCSYLSQEACPREAQTAFYERSASIRSASNDTGSGPRAEIGSGEASIARMRIDAHQHYWKLERGDYDWMSAPDVAALRRDFLPDDLAPELTRHGFERSVVVQAAATHAETDYLLERAEDEPTIAGVVGWLDVEAPDFPDVLAGYVSRPGFLGIRPMLQDLSDDRFLVRPLVLEHLAELARSQRTLDLLVFPRHLPAVAEALARVPELRAVVDHCAKPDLRSGSLDDWRSGIARVAEFPNVVCKVSGLVTEAPPGARAADIAPAVEHVLSVFGPERVLFGSDWPVCTLASSYERVVALLDEVLGARLTDAFRRLLFGENAARFYGLPR